MMVRPVAYGIGAACALLAVFFGITTLISGAAFAASQFSAYWYFFVALAIGFGIQIGLFAYLKGAVARRTGSGAVVAVSGTTSTAAMLSCCAHYLANILPVVGITGAISFISQYQVEFFWVGIVANLGGIAYLAYKLKKFSHP